ARGVWGETLVILASDNGGVGGWHEPSTDLRGAKGSLYERGLRTPLLVAGPGVEVGLVDDVVTGVDLLPTLVELLGLSADSTPSAVQPARSAQPTRASGPAFAGRSFAALLRSDPATAPQLDRVGEAYFWELRPRAAPDRHTLAGRWLQLAVQRRLDGRRYKLVKTDLYAGGDEPQLFDLDADPAESRDLGAERPAVRRYLHDLWRAWRLETATHRPTLLRDGALCADGPLLFVGDRPVTVVDHPALTIGRLDFSVTFQLTVGRQPGSSSWIVGRDGVWSLGLENSRIVLEFAGNRPHRLVHPRVLQTGETVRVAASIMNRRGLSIAVDDRVARARVRFGALPESDAPIQLGLAPDGGESFVGEVDDLLFFPIALGAEDLSLQGLGRSAFVDGMTPVITLPGEARTHAVEVQARFAARVGSGRGSRGAAADGEGDADGGGGFLPFQLEIHCLRGGQVDWHPRARSVEARLAGPEDLIHRVRHLCPAGSEGLRLALTDGGAGALGELETGDLETGAVELGRLGRALLDAGFEADEPIVGRPGPDLDASAKTGSHALRLAPGTTTPTLTLDTRGARALDVSLWARTDPGTVATLSLELSCLDAEGHALRTETGTGPEKRSALTSPGRVDGEWRRFRLLTSCPDGPLTRSVGLRLHTAGEGSVLVDDLAVVVP
ncbi:MAG: sulfatase-like hydrolase/transferase, partial [Acidobacteriota bacterium]